MDYSKMTTEEFDVLLAEMVHRECAALLQVPGVYELLAEYFNNEILDIWAERNPEKIEHGE